MTAPYPPPAVMAVAPDAHNIDDLVGNTPLLRLDKTAARAGLSPGVALYAKAEWYNPSGSVKARAARHIIRQAEATGALRPGMTLLDSTSGNMGIAYAMFGAARGYPVRLAVPANASPERLAILGAYGAELTLTDPLEGSDGAILVARAMADATPSLFYANQYNNPANWQAHFETTGPEIWEQTAGRITHFVAGLGTSGTFTGTTRRLKDLNPAIHAIAMQPDAPFHGLEGLKHMATAIQPGIYEAGLADVQLTVRTETAYDTARQLARDEGLFVGVSAAAAVRAALDVAAGLDEGVVVTVLPDSGMKYLSDPFWQNG